MSVNYDQLFNSRRTWKPQFLTPTPLEFPEHEETANVCQRILALGLELELPVGAWVAEATKKELPISAAALRLLKSNIADETIHQRALERAIVAYPISDRIREEAQHIALAWLECGNYHPLVKPALLECGVFMSSLAILYLVGGQSLSNLGNDISKDEQRHVSTNRSILRDCGTDPTNPQTSLRKIWRDTIGWTVGDWIHPDLGIDADFFIEESINLVERGKSRELAELTGGAVYTPPFEVFSNARLY